MMGKVIMSGIVPPLVAPISGIPLSDIAEGSLVKLNENGSPVEFYVAKHDYESALNGTGRTLLVRKDCYDEHVWASSNVNTYASSNIDSWLNNTYKYRLDIYVQAILGTTSFYYTPGNGNNNVATLERSVFMLSVTELGKTASFANVEGSKLPIANNLKVAYLNGTAIVQYTRSPQNDSTMHACCLLANGNASTSGCQYAHGSRPAFTLPSNAVFDETTMLLKGVA